MKRRQFLENAAIVTLGLTATQIARAESTEKIQAKPNPLLLQSTEIVKALPHFAESVALCALKGELCVQFCEEELAKGAVEFSNCSIASNQMVVVCEMVAKLASMKSVRLSETLDVCSNACKACKESCEEHKAHWQHGMHLECKVCAEHCDKLIAEVAKLKALLTRS